MIYETDIIRELTNRIKKYFPSKKVENQDIKNCLEDRPCFFVRNIQAVDTQTAVKYELNSFSLEVIYFAKENNKGYLELLQTKRLLKAILNKPLKVVKSGKASFIEIETNTSSINEDDYVLNSVLEIKLEQLIDYSDLGVDLDSDNITDDPDYNRELMEECQTAERIN